MKNKIIWIAVGLLLTGAMLLASCTTGTTTTSSKPATTTTTTTTKQPVTTTTTTTTSKPVTTAQSGNWWSKLGTPQYGGEIVMRLGSDIASWDPYFGGVMNVESAYLERLMMDDWTLDPAVFDYRITWRPPQYLVGQLATGWEFTDANTFVFHIRKGVPWQNIPPANGREVTADDILAHYVRMFPINGSTGSPYTSKVTYIDLISASAPDKYTLAFKWKPANPETTLETMLAVSTDLQIMNPDAIKLYGNDNKWNHVIGTGPFIPTDYVTASSATLVRNPNYWASDERYPQNKLPYIDTLKFLVIPDTSTALAATRTGKIDFVDGISRVQAQQIQKTNPEILVTTSPDNSAATIDPRNDVKPFSDIKVRMAMQKAMDLKSIAADYYGGFASPSPLTLTSYSEKGWGWPYEQWPQALKDEYSYDPAAAKKLLADAGYPNGFKTNVTVQNSADLDLLQVVKSYLAAVNIDMEIRPMDPAAWTAFVQQSKKHDAMAMRKGGSLALSYEPIRQLYRFQTNYSVNYAMVSDPTFDNYMVQATAAQSVDDIKKVLRDANEYVIRHHWVISLVESSAFSLSQPWVIGYNGQAGSVSGTGTGPSVTFYVARFWVDQKLKKSFGH